MIPTPGMHQNGNVSTMIPTPGIETSMVSGPSPMNVVPNAMGMGSMPSNNNENSSLVQYNALLATDSNSGNMLPATDNNPTLSGALNNPFQAQQGVGTMPNSIIKGMGLPRGSQMIPTPGMNNSQSISMNSASSSGLVRSNVDSLGHSQHQQLQQQQQQQQFGGGQNNRIYSNMNGQVSGIMGMGMQHKNTSYGLLNGGMNNGMHLVGSNHYGCQVFRGVYHVWLGSSVVVMWITIMVYWGFTWGLCLVRVFHRITLMFDQGLPWGLSK
eukprot:TRINITY_DN4112_c0_g1_i5.p1 TRINITY_DN4112_c0_g1~~TRINITY_DN4112_c0_g1_i5.p1  ORF type:complete len:269 (+),score=46.44 TRINITY_DN4112_c0_g1_i5:1211-2017(+)